MDVEFGRSAFTNMTVII